MQRSIEEHHDVNFKTRLSARILEVAEGRPFARDYESFVNDPLAIWIEGSLGVEWKDGRLVRCKPQSITGEEGVWRSLADLTGLDAKLCEAAIQQALLAGYECEKNPETGFPPFAFRLHQFISRGDTVYATLEDEETRHLTIYGQQFKPGSREHALLPMVFCRECGQEYYCVRRIFGADDEPDYFIQRQLNDQLNDEGENEAGFLYFSADRPFPTEEAEVIDDNRLPDDWLEERGGRLRVRRDRQDQLPQAARVGADGVENPDGLNFNMSYYNQREHRILDRKLIRDELLRLAGAVTEESPASAPRASHLEQLLQQSDSELERRWLRYLDERGHRLPSHAQLFIEAAQTRPDFVYRDEQVAVYVDGPIHDFPERRERDQRQTVSLEDLGYTVVRFGHAEEWAALLQNYPHVFGAPQYAGRAPAAPEANKTDQASSVDSDLFAPEYIPLLEAIAAALPNAVIEPGGDVISGGRVVGGYFAEVVIGGVRLRLIDAIQAEGGLIKEALADGGFRAFLVEPRDPERTIEIIKQALEEK